jgi:choline dehydrogenase-like flavoprotein
MWLDALLLTEICSDKTTVCNWFRQTVNWWIGTCRMGREPKSSVINPDHRAHAAPNLFICDGSSFVTSGRGQPTCTIQALAYRAAERIARLAKSGEIKTPIR